MKKLKLPEYIPWLYRNMKRRLPLILLQILLSVFGAYMSVQFSLGTRRVINGAVSGEQSQFWDACLIQALVVIAMVSCSLISSYLDSFVRSHLNRDFKRSILRKILRCEYCEISRYHSGDLIQRLNADSLSAYGGVLTIATGLVGTFTAFVSSVFALVEIAPGFTLALGVAAFVAGAISMLLKNRLKQLHKDSSASGGKVSGFLFETVSKLMVIQALDVSEEMGRRADATFEHNWQVQRRQRNMHFLTSLGSSLLVYSSSFITLVWCAWELFHGRLSYGDVSALIALVGSARATLMNFPRLIPQFVAISAACERIMEIEQLPDQSKPDQTSGLELYAEMTGFRAEHLTFSYDRDPVMQDVCLTIPKGGLTVIVGPSGIGKSTLLKLMLGLYRPNEGELLIDTKDGPINVSRAARSLFSYAPQGNFLLSGTLRENLTLTNPNATDEQIRQALYVSAMDEYVATLPQGLETPLRENGAGLSEGQAQRLSLARAIISGAPVLLLDEVTSSLDAATEAIVLERICALPGKTCIAVTHRPAAMELADHVIEVTEHAMTLTTR